MSTVLDLISASIKLKPREQLSKQGVNSLNNVAPKKPILYDPTWYRLQTPSIVYDMLTIHLLDELYSLSLAFISAL